tara:strand:- start:141 stop:473 length:333 start_codon:yes stop_codon:yes gene_type:complete
MRRFLLAPILLTLVAGCGPYEPPKPSEWSKYAAEASCPRQIKKLLRDPDSFQIESTVILSTSGEYNQWGKAYIIYRAKNAFGGYARGGAECEAYDGGGGERWIKARLLES